MSLRSRFSAIQGERGAGSRLSPEQEDAYAHWSEPPYWNFLTGTWPLKGTKTRPAIPIIWTLDQDEKRERPMPSVGYEYAREVILDPMFLWQPDSAADRLLYAIRKARKVLGTLWAVMGAGAEVTFKDAVSWKFVKGKHEEATDIVAERLRFAYSHRNFPDWLRVYRPIRPQPVGRFARYEPGSPRGVNVSMFSVAGTNFGVKEAKGGTNDWIVDEAVEVEGLRSAIEAARPGARRIILIATPPEPGAKGKRGDPDSLAYFSELCDPSQAGKTLIKAPSHQRRDYEPDTDYEDDAELIGAL